MEQLRQKKQQFLRDQILEKGYDATLFIQFAEKLIGKTLDIDILQLASLQQVIHLHQLVEKFKITQNNQTQKDNQIASKNQPLSEPPAQQIDQFQKSLIFKNTHQVKQQWDQQWTKPSKNTGNSFDFGFMDQFESSLNKIQSLYKQQKTETPETVLDLLDFTPIPIPVSVPVTIETGFNKMAQNFNQAKMKNKATQKQKVIPAQTKQIKQNSIKQQKKEHNQPKYQSKKSLPIKAQTNWKIKCRRTIPRQSLNNSSLQVCITNHQITSKGSLLFDYVLYSIHTKPLNIQVRRRYADFVALRNALRNFYPTIKLPHLQKSHRLSETDIENIKKQRVYLQYFLDHLINNRQIRKSKFLQDFLLIKDQSQFKSKLRVFYELQQQYQKLHKVKSVQEISNLDGYLQANMNQNIQPIVQSMLTLTDATQSQFLRLKNLSTQLLKHRNQIQRLQNQFAETFHFFLQDVQKFNAANPQNATFNLQKTLKNTIQICKQQAQSAKAQCNIVQNEMKNFYKYQGLNICGMRQLIKTRNYLSQEYNKRKQKQGSSFQKYSQLGKYKTALDSPSRNFTQKYLTRVLRYQTGVYNNSVLKQFQLQFKRLSQTIRKHFHTLGRLHLTIHSDVRLINQMTILWRDLIS